MPCNCLTSIYPAFNWLVQQLWSYAWDAPGRLHMHLLSSNRVFRFLVSHNSWWVQSLFTYKIYLKRLTVWGYVDQYHKAVWCYFDRAGVERFWYHGDARHLCVWWGCSPRSKTMASRTWKAFWCICKLRTVQHAWKGQHCKLLILLILLILSLACNAQPFTNMIETRVPLLGKSWW